MRLLVAIYFLLYKSCHPSVVASIIQHWLIAVNDFRVLHMQRSFKATALEDSNKTELEYLWLLPPELDEMAVEILQLRGTGFANFTSLKESLRNYWVSHVLANIWEVHCLKDQQKQLYLHSMNNFCASESVKLKIKCIFMGLQPVRRTLSLTRAGRPRYKNSP